MAFYLVAYFTNNGAPATGLAPTVDLYDLSDNSKVVDAQAMTEVALGLYKYLYASYDPTKNYAGRADGGSSLSNSERYAALTSGVNALGEVVEGTLTLRAVMRILLSYCAGLTTGGGGTVLKYRDNVNSKDRVSMTVNKYGNRSSVTLDGD